MVKSHPSTKIKIKNGITLPERVDMYSLSSLLCCWSSVSSVMTLSERPAICLKTAWHEKKIHKEKF